MKPLSSTSTRSQQPRSASHSKVASLRYLPNGIMLELDAAYNKDFLSSFKATIPSKKRVWDQEDRKWYVVRDQFEKLTYLLDQYYTETLLLDFPKQEVSPDAWSTLWLLPYAPIEVVRAAYRALATKHHPDRGGDATRMQEVNAAYKTILGELSNGEEKGDPE